MARFSRMKVLSTMMDTGMVSVFYNPDFGVAHTMAAAILRSALLWSLPAAARKRFHHVDNGNPKGIVPMRKHFCQLLTLLIWTHCAYGATAVIFCPQGDSRAVFGANELRAALAEKGTIVSSVQDISTLTGGTESVRFVRSNGTAPVAGPIQRMGPRVLLLRAIVTSPNCSCSDPHSNGV
jgi:hypothetical protein